MTIGDEKVVAEVGTVFDLRWIGSGPLAYLVNRHGVKVGDKLVPLKAYAELAAELEEWKFRVEQLDALATRINDRADTAESQLAELRGKLEGLASEYAAEAERHLMHAANKDWAEWVRADHSSRASELNGAAREIRTLAAADSSLQSRDGG